MTIGKSMTILCDGVVGGMVVSGSNGVLINAGANDVVVLKGLDIEGLGMTTGGQGLNGIKVLAAAAVHVEDCIIRNFRAATPNGFAIQFANSTALTFTVKNTSMVNNGTGATGGAMQVRPTAGATTGTISNSTATRNIFGIAADGAGGSTGINLSIDSSQITGSVLGGVVAVTGAIGTGIMVTRSTVSNNGTAFQSSGAGANIRVGYSQATGNGNATSGTISSYTPATNQVNGNGNDGVFVGVALR